MSGEMATDRLPTAFTLWPPAHAVRQFDVLWTAGGEPFGLIVDGRGYRVRPSPGLRVRDGMLWQPLYERRERPEPPEPPERP